MEKTTEQQTTVNEGDRVEAPIDSPRRFTDLFSCRPFYSDDRCVIFNADSRELVPLVDTVDLVLTDPPYGINHQTDFASRGRGRMTATKDYLPCRGDDEQFDPSALLRFDRWILWGANNYKNAIPDGASWLIWDKRTRNDKGTNDQADGEMAATNCVKGVRIFRHMWNGMWKDSERGLKLHPMRKPTALMRWCLGKAQPRGIVFDPYMGSGPVAEACKLEGVPYVGIEIEESYCETSANRLRQTATLF